MREHRNRFDGVARLLDAGEKVQVLTVLTVLKTKGLSLIQRSANSKFARDSEQALFTGEKSLLSSINQK
jgi:hypothetical protein